VKGNKKVNGTARNSMNKPTEEEYEECAKLAHEINEIAATGSLADLLPMETDHSYLCRLGIWYWSLGHRMLAAMAYERSIEIMAEPATYFNLAVCCDDMGQNDRAEKAMIRFYEIVPSKQERSQAETMLREENKEHLIRAKQCPR
jgi:tetratricopeptide (TPR) repeat protein